MGKLDPTDLLETSYRTTPHPHARLSVKELDDGVPIAYY